MTSKSKTVDHQICEPDIPTNNPMPHWDQTDPAIAFHTTTTREEWNRGWVEGARVRSMDVLIGKVNLLLSLAAVIAFINAAMLILIVAHSTGG